ncbi:MAG: hypothetical protein ACYCZO_09760, partial [Daejeonella sp.]
MLAVRAKPNGIEIEFTEPLKENTGNNAFQYNIKQWWYKPTENYGGPKMEEETLMVKNTQVSADRKKVFLELANMKPKHVIYVQLDKNMIISKSGKNLWSTEAWYTLTNIPSK